MLVENLASENFCLRYAVFIKNLRKLCGGAGTTSFWSKLDFSHDVTLGKGSLSPRIKIDSFYDTTRSFSRRDESLSLFKAFKELG